MIVPDLIKAVTDGQKKAIVEIQGKCFMNERIRELAHEAGLPTYNPEGIPTKLEKFAELIVRECADICYNREYTDGSRYGDEIIEHFGAK